MQHNNRLFVKKIIAEKTKKKKPSRAGCRCGVEKGSVTPYSGSGNRITDGEEIEVSFSVSQ